VVRHGEALSFPHPTLVTGSVKRRKCARSRLENRM
jgi:hypothetical protein